MDPAPVGAGCGGRRARRADRRVRSTPRSTSSPATRPTSSSRSTPTSRSSPTTSRGCSTAFDADPALGIASGSALRAPGRRLAPAARDRLDRVGRVARLSAGRACRRSCRFEERVGWDGIDEFKANARGWSTLAFEDLPFHHHRREGERDGAWRARREPGPCRVLHRLPPLVSRPALALQRAPRARRPGDDRGLRRRRRAPGAAQRRRRRARLPSSPAERAEPAGSLARGDRTPRPRGLTPMRWADRALVGVVIRTLNESELIGRCLETLARAARRLRARRPRRRQRLDRRDRRDRARARSEDRRAPAGDFDYSRVAQRRHRARLAAISSSASRPTRSRSTTIGSKR